MRSLGQFTDARQLAVFRDYLTALGLPCHVDPQPGANTLWVLDEDQLDQARQELVAFQTQPEDPKYRELAEQAAVQLAAKFELELQRHRRQSVRPLSAAGPFQGIPVTATLIVLCVMVTLLTRFGNDLETTNFFRMSEFLRLDKNSTATSIWVLPLLKEIREEGNLWRLVSPIFIHFDAIHLVMNLYWLAVFGRKIELLRGSARFLLLVLVIAILSNLAQFFWGGENFDLGGPDFGGISGVGYGLFGYLWFKTLFAPEDGFSLDPMVSIMFVCWMIFCMTPFIANVANMAHFSGLICGLSIAALSKGIRFLTSARR